MSSQNKIVNKSNFKSRVFSLSICSFVDVAGGSWFN
jgi:hypothetical protein